MTDQPQTSPIAPASGPAPAEAAAAPRSIELPGTDWQRVSPKYIAVDIVGYVIFGGIMTVAGFIPFWVSGWAPSALLGVALGVLFLAVIALTPRRVRAIGYALREDDLLFRRGILFQRVVAVPYGRMQLVDITRGPIARAVGLAELKFVTAAASTGVLIPGLPLADAERLRDHLVAVAETRRAGL